MGYMTPIVILNDTFDRLQKDPQWFVDFIRDNMNDGGDSRGVRVLPTRHADEFRLFGIHGNFTVELSPYSKETRELGQDSQYPFRREVLEDYVRAAEYQLEALKTWLWENPL